MPIADRIMETKSFPYELKSLSTSTGKFAAYVSIYGNVDSDNEIVEPGAFVKSITESRKRPNFKGFPVMRNHEELIGISEREDVHDKTGLLIEGRISTSPAVPKAAETLQLMKEEILNGWSFQFRTVRHELDEETGIRRLIELAYFEGGPVDMPANEATYTVDLKSVVPFQDLALAELGRGWDSAAAKKRVQAWAGGNEIDWKRYRRAFVWYNQDAPGLLGSYKLPIADVIDGQLKAVPRAIFAAASVLAGGRGGVNIPDADLPKAKAHIARYYGKMGRESPFKSGLGIYELLAATADIAETTIQKGEALDTEIIRAVEQTIEPLQILRKSPVAPVSKTTRHAESMSALERLESLQRDINDHLKRIQANVN